MTDLLVLDLVEKKLVTDQIVLTVGYDIENMTRPDIHYTGEVTVDGYGRRVPKHAHGTVNLGRQTSSTKLIIDKVMKLYDEIVNRSLLVRRITVVANHLVEESTVAEKAEFEQLNLFTDYVAQQEAQAAEQEEREKERKLQEAMLSVKKKFGKNAMIKGMNLQEGAMTVERNKQIGGHKA